MATSTEGLKFGFKKRVTTASPALPTPLESTPQDEGPPMQYITVVGDHSEAEAADCPKVIPAQQDSFRVGGKPSFVPSFVPDADESLRKKGLGEERFEKEVVVKTENEAVSYGLNLRQGADKHSIKGEDGVDVKEEVKSEHGLAGPITDTRSEREEQTYLEHMTALPDEAGIEAYEDMPVSEFGKALLRGMDWKEGDPVGRNKKNKAMEVLEFIPRDSRLGLGAKPSAITAGKKRKHTNQGDMVLPPSADGRVRHTKTLDEKLVPRSSLGVHPGKKMRITDGRHSGMFCQVVELLKVQKGRSERASVRLLVNDEVVPVRVSELSEPDKKVSHSTEQSLNGKEKPASDLGSGFKGMESKKLKDDSKIKKKSSQRENTQVQLGPSWLYPGIRVRVIDKKIKGGRHYLKKGVVDDVLSPGVANVAMEDSSEVLEAINQQSLETVIPKKPQGKVLLLAGDHKGKRAVLLEKRTDKGVAAVQIAEDMSVVRVHLDDIAEFVSTYEEM